HSPWSVADGWRLGHAGERLLLMETPGGRVELHAAGSGGSYSLREADGRLIQVEGASLDAGALALRVDGQGHRFNVDVDARRVIVHADAGRQRFERVSPLRSAGDDKDAGDDRIRA